MSLELLNTLGTFLTAAIVAATAAAAIVQLRHLRAGNQINAMLNISNQFDRREFRDAMHVIRYKLGGVMEDPLFREYLLARNRVMPMPAVPDEFHQIGDAFALVGNTFGELGIFVKNDIIERSIFLERFAFTINLVWDRMVPSIAWIRAATGEPTLWENFELLAAFARDFLAGHRSPYPKYIPRLEMHNPWPVPSKSDGTAVPKQPA